MDLSLQMQQRQMLSQRMQQSVEILQMNTLALSEYIREMTEENPLLEWKEESAPQQEEMRLLERLQWLQESDEQNRGYYQMEMDSEREREDLRFGKKEAQSLREYLQFQIHLLPITEREKKILTFLAESTEESGYLETGALEAAMQRYQLSQEEAERLLVQMQALDPPGVGARTLIECLQIQLRQKGACPQALEIVEQYLPDVAKNRLAFVAKKLHISMEVMMDALEEIKSCVPKPGSGYANDRPLEYVIPDVFVERRGDELSVHINSHTTPRLYINPSYQKILREDSSKETKDYVAQKLRQAEWTVQCVHRRESTLLETAQQIVAAQKEFFLYPNGCLQPLRMVDVAEWMQVHESTVSRAVKDKYLQCEKGVFALADFFSKAVATDHAEEISVQQIQKRLTELMETEDKRHPLSDRELTEQLTAEGIRISRRTVAKYRENMGIPGASGRKQYGERR